MPTTVNLYAANIDLRTGINQQDAVRYFVFVELEQVVTRAGTKVAVRQYFPAYFHHEFPICLIPRNIWDCLPGSQRAVVATPTWWNDALSLQLLRNRRYEFGTFAFTLMQDPATASQRTLNLEAIFPLRHSGNATDYILLGWNFIYREHVSFDFQQPPPLRMLTVRSTPLVGTIEIP
jgi:hypothetical protein